jgi:hypothetical protein
VRAIPLLGKEVSFTADSIRSGIGVPRGIQMSEPDVHSDHDKIDLVQIISLVLSIYILGALVIQTLFQLSPETTELLDEIDFLICFFFLYDFFIRFYKAKSKLQFLKWGWIDLISSIPVLGVSNGLVLHASSEL